MNMAKMIDKEVTVTAKTATVTDRIMVTVATMATAAMVMADTPALEMAATALPITTQLASVTMATMAMDTISPLMVVAQRRLITPYLTTNKATTRRATTQMATTQRATTTHTATTLKATAAPKATTPRAMAHRATTHMAMTTKAMAPKAMTLKATALKATTTHTAMTLKATMTISKVVTTDTMIRGMVRRMLMPLKPQTSRAQQAHPQTNKTTPKLLRKPTLQETTIPSSTSLPQTRTSMVLMTCMLLNRTTQPKASSATRRTWIKSTWALLTKWNHIPSQIQHLRLPTTETKRRMKSE